MIIPITEINSETLHNIVESFVLREGTDYGDYNTDLSGKVKQVIAQLHAGNAVLVYSEEHESVDIRPASDF